MKYIGAHVSTEGGVFNAVSNAKEIGAKAFALFVKNQRQWNAKPLENDVILKFKKNMSIDEYSQKYVLPHAGYLINLGHPSEENRKKSVDSFIDEMNRCYQLGLTCLNIHPGSHLGEISEEKCISLISESINYSLKTVPKIKIIIENTAGQGSNLGYKFEHLRDIISRIDDQKRIGVCLDTCHTYSAGYDIKDPVKYEGVMTAFERTIGFKYLSGIHLNDSKVEFGSRKDRHENLGKGYLGIDFFRRFINDPRFDNMPIVLETIDSSLWAQEISMLYDMIKR